ncbi:MAG: L,D-transpeptidase family protein [Pseudomonadota bacterium]|nr:L,D-transpeptidase family protein [Pseudomonadota bacterium]
MPQPHKPQQVNYHLMLNSRALLCITLLSLLPVAAPLASAIPDDVRQQLEKDNVISSPSTQTKHKQEIEKPAHQEKHYALDYIGNTEKYTAKYEDTLIHLARKNNLGFVDIRSANPHLDPWIPGEGTEVILPKRHILPNAPREGVVINLAEMRLYYFDKNGNAPKTFPIGIGREGLQTPLGTTKVVRKAIGPSWRPTERMRKEDPDLPEVVEAGPDNPLGTHALYLGWPQYAIHGTNRPYGIGRRVSSGCIRMYPEAIVKAYDLIDVKTPVTVVDQALKVGWVEDMLYIEAHAGQELADEMEKQGKVTPQKLSSDQIAYIKKTAKDRTEEINWDIAQKAFDARSGYPVPVLYSPEEVKMAAAIDEITEEKSAEVEAAPEGESASAENETALTAAQEEAKQRILNASYND